MLLTLNSGGNLILIMNNIVSLHNLSKQYSISKGIFSTKLISIKALENINLNINRGECLGIVGESGCGKTTLAKTIVGMHRPTSGKIFYYNENEDPVDISLLSKRELIKNNIRSKLQMVFQDPTSSLNSRMLVKNIIAEPIKVTQRLKSQKLRNRIIELLYQVGLSEDHLMRYPHEFSGGQRQRLAIARAIATNPDFIVLDEPTSALDVSVQAQILNLLKDLQSKMSLTYLFITHHLLVVRTISMRIAVMYLGNIVELADTETLFNKPMHPYTKALLSSIPIPNIDKKKQRVVLSGELPDPASPPTGCHFNPRCPITNDKCKTHQPNLIEIDNGHYVSCFFAGQ